MNRGNTKQNTPHNKIDVVVDRINKKIARLMGKKGKLPQQKKTSNTVFGIIVVVFSIVLWVSTGFYYLGENQSGLILQNGIVTKVVKGIKVGFTLPYPFGNMEVVNTAPSEQIDLNKVNSSNDDFNVLSQDLYPIQVAAKFSYQIANPKLAFQSVLQKQDNLDSFVAWQVQMALHDYFMHKLNSAIVKANLTLIANNVREQLNYTLAKSGITLLKLNIYSIHSPQTSHELAVANVSESALESQLQKFPEQVQISSEASALIQQLLDEAALYKQNLLLDTQVNINQFNQLLPQYNTNPNAIVEQMYYDTLAAIPSSSANNYPLLNLPLSELLMQQSKAMLQNNDISAVAKASPAPTFRERDFSRSVDRRRNFSEGAE